MTISLTFTGIASSAAVSADNQIIVAPLGLVCTETVKCKKITGYSTCAQWKLFSPNCRINDANCAGKSPAYLPATTVCSQNLF